MLILALVLLCSAVAVYGLRLARRTKQQEREFWEELHHKLTKED